MDTHKHITLSFDEVEAIIKDLGLIIVSMDHIGSSHHDEPSQQATEMRNYFLKIKAFEKLAQARSILSKAHRAQSTQEDVLRLEESAEDLPYWKQNES